MINLIGCVIAAVGCWGVSQIAMADIGEELYWLPGVFQGLALLCTLGAVYFFTKEICRSFKKVR